MRLAGSRAAVLLFLSACIRFESSPGLTWEPTSTTEQFAASTTEPQTEEALNGGREVLFPDDSGVINVKKVYGASGDGVTDDTAALQKAIQENVGKSRILYLPNGTYLVSDALEWRDSEGRWQPFLTLQGESREGTIIKLQDTTAKFAEPQEPLGVIVTGSGLFRGDPSAGGKDYQGRGEGNEAFRNYIFDLTVDTGHGNPGAIGIDFLANNNGGVVNVTIRAGDGSGVAGLSMTRKWPGPALIKNVTVEGFELGVHTGRTEYGLTFENLTLVGQGVAGILNQGNVLSILGLASRNQVPAVQNVAPPGLVVLIEADLRGGAASASAIESDGFLYARSVTTDGYRSAIEGESGSSVDEYAEPESLTLFSSPDGSLRLPIEETPQVRWGDPEDWAGVADPVFAGGANPADHEDDTEAIQAALNSGKATIYFPPGGGPGEGYIVSNTLSVPPSVRHIVGLQSSVIPGSNFGTDPEKPLFRFEVTSRDPVIVERIDISRNGEHVFGTAFLQAASRPLVLTHVSVLVKTGLRTTAGAGPVFIEDYCCSSIRLGPSGRVWARQLNLESAVLKLSNPGSSLWILGIKTEQPSTVISTTNGGQTELLGGLLYPVAPVPRNLPAFEASGLGEHSLIYAVSAYDQTRNYAIQVTETEGGRTRWLMSEDVPSRGLGSAVPLYLGP
ncbi:MAG: glycosyl hydrolase family 28-related protein [Acidimicrobiia bacterium]